MPGFIRQADLLSFLVFLSRDLLLFANPFLFLSLFSIPNPQFRSFPLPVLFSPFALSRSTFRALPRSLFSSLISLVPQAPFVRFARTGPVAHFPAGCAARTKRLQNGMLVLF